MQKSVDETLAVAGNLYNRGQFPAAQAELAGVLEAEPDNLTAHVC